MSDKTKKTIIMSLGVFLLVIAVFGATYAYFDPGGGSSNNVSGNSATAIATVGVNTIKSGNLIPTADADVETSLLGSYPCQDSRGYSLCSLYQITFTNNGPAVKLNAKITLNSSTTYTTNHLKYQLYTNSWNVYFAESDIGTLDIVGGTDNFIYKNGQILEFNFAASRSVVYYLAIWLGNYDGNQLEDANKTLSANIVFESPEGGVVSEFLGTDVTVTFDADGGTVATESKQVSYGSTYGLLPIPEKAGYRFLGWNGKNMFNKDDIDNDHYLVAATGVISNTPGANYLDTWASSKAIKVLPNTTYIKSGNIGGVTQSYFDSNMNLISFDSVAENVSFTTPANCYYVKFNLNRANAPYDDIQFEVGNATTNYESFYVTGSTQVTNEVNHTLKAIWEPE